MIEVSTGISTSNPDFNTGIMSSENLVYDYSLKLIGDRTRSLLSSDPYLEKSLSSFTSSHKINREERPILVAVPGLVVTSRTTFKKQAEYLQEIGIDVLGMDYSSESHSKELASAQILDLLNSRELKNKKVSLLGLSLGAGLIIDTLLGDENYDFGNLDNIILIGSVHSDADLKNSVFAKTFGFANKHTPDVLANRFAPLAKRLFTLDPQYPPSSRDEILEVPNSTLIDRLKTLSKVPADTIKVIKNKAMIGWWDDDYSSSEAKSRIESLFHNAKVFSIPGHHGWTYTGSDAINRELSNAFNI